jgi:hypothetical protein
MTAIQTHARIDAQGRVNIVVPLDPLDAGTEVIVTITPLDRPTSSSELTQTQWREAIDRTTGSITDPTFKRLEQPVIDRIPEF